MRVKTEGFIKPLALRGEYGFSSLVKQNKKAKICFVIYIAGFFFLNFFCYEVIAKQKKKKCPDNYYSCVIYDREGSNDAYPQDANLTLFGEIYFP